MENNHNQQKMTVFFRPVTTATSWIEARAVASQHGPLARNWHHPAREVCLHDISTLWRCALRLVLQDPLLTDSPWFQAYWSPVTINIGRENRQHAQVGRLPFPWLSKYSNISTYFNHNHNHHHWPKIFQQNPVGHGSMVQIAPCPVFPRSWRRFSAPGYAPGGLAINIFPILGGKNQTVNPHDIPQIPIFAIDIPHDSKLLATPLFGNAPEVVELSYVGNSKYRAGETRLAKCEIRRNRLETRFFFTSHES